MTGSVMIGNNRVELAATLGTMLRYKQQFGQEYNDDISELNALKDADEQAYYTKLAVTGVKLIWAMAKTADESTPSFDVWTDIFEGVDIAPVMTEAVRLYTSSLGEHEEEQQADKDNDDDSEDEPFNTEKLVALCVAYGLSIDDINKLTVSSVISIMSEIASFHKTDSDDKNTEDNSGGIRKATPADIQAFFG
ncbi:MAG: hypothetical protein K6F91_09985 [Ruminococcus sp.]|nr:hypothetical protein [Ruminococcus sp.]